MPSKRDPSKPSKRSAKRSRPEPAKETPVQFQVPTAEIAKKLGVSVEELSEALQAGEVVVEYRKVGDGFRSSFTYDGQTAELEYHPVSKH